MNVERPADREGINEVLTNALLLYAMNHPYPDEIALMINGQELTPRDLVYEVREGTEIGLLALRHLGNEARQKGLKQVVQELNPDQDASNLIRKWRME